MILDGLVQPGCLPLWGHAQFTLEYALTFLVLAQGRGPLFGSGIQSHQAAVGWFVQGVQRQPAPGIRDGRPVLALISKLASQTLQPARQIGTQPVALKELPLVEGGAVAQGEAL